MSIFSKIFGRKEPPTRIDPVFGIIKFENALWSHIPPQREAGFMVIIDAPESGGPSDSQRGFFQKINTELSIWIGRARQHDKEKSEAGFDVIALDVYSVIIGNEQDTLANQFTIELCDENAFKIHGVRFKGSVPVEYYCDD